VGPLDDVSGADHDMTVVEHQDRHGSLPAQALNLGAIPSPI
jgi:hypothetical protein